MKAYMTNGTVDFLQKLIEKHKEIPLLIMTNAQGALAYYEDYPKNIFQSGRGYEVIGETGAIQREGYVVMNNIPVTDDSKAIFEERFKNRKNDVDKMPGFQAFRLLRPLKGNKYVVLTQWKSESDFNNWKNSNAFKQAHGKQIKKPAYYADRPFVTTYHMLKEKEE